ncbi:MAG TPA: FixH family protein [Candidatus Kapabacteria bacterium]|nr:FixH family protein [Candidatus Kapabacteria bacterium]
MKIYGNWGLLVPTFFFTFVVLFGSLVIWTSTQSFELVDDKYYEKEKDFNKQIEKMERSNRLSEQLAFFYSDNQLNIKFPKIANYNMMKGEVYFFRPSEKNLDFKASFNVDSGYTAAFASERLKEGLWKLKVNWSAGDSTYYSESSFIAD